MKSKKQIILDIKGVVPIKGRNSMGVNESFYNPYFLLKHFKTLEELEQLNEKELNLILELAGFASDVFY